MKEMTLLELIEDARLEIPVEHFEKILESAKKLIEESDIMLEKIAFAQLWLPTVNNVLDYEEEEDYD